MWCLRFIGAAWLLALTSCNSMSTVWVHRYLEWPGLVYDRTGEPVVPSEAADPLERAHAALARAGIRIHHDCGVELPVCAALGCPGRALELYIEISEPHLDDALDLGYTEAVPNRPPKEEDGFNPCEPL